jgi:hypothetical protein
MPLVLTSCTNRKRTAPPQALMARGIAKGNLESVAAEWSERLISAKPIATVADLYCGRAFRQAEDAAAKANAALYIISAGLGMVSAERTVPSYSLTVVPRAQDSIFSRIDGNHSAAEWWEALSRSSPFSLCLNEVARRHQGLILAALPATYLAMIVRDLGGLPEDIRSRLRIFNLGGSAAIPVTLRDYLMPYDDRFDGADAPLPGTRGDFAQRALWHFVKAVLPLSPKGDSSEHAAAIDRLLGLLQPRQMPVRRTLSDGEITALIHRHWLDASGQSSRMLRYLRDTLGVSCEQGRFKNLFNAAKHERGEVA